MRGAEAESPNGLFRLGQSTSVIRKISFACQADDAAMQPDGQGKDPDELRRIEFEKRKKNPPQS
jgi:hypothetical protein